MKIHLSFSTVATTIHSLRMHKQCQFVLVPIKFIPLDAFCYEDERNIPTSSASIIPDANITSI